ncbi:MAG TPA: hypothetical protein VJA25_15055 [Dehalococcoidia bacterium]|nr:hypothetical protein [Dehalococcoidia bacterium]
MPKTDGGGSKPRPGARVRKARQSGMFAPEVFRGTANFATQIRRAASTLPGPQAKKLKKTVRKFRKSL